MKYLKITQGQITLIDDDMYDFISRFKWYALKASNSYYAIKQTILSDGTQTSLSLHRFIMGLQYNDPLEVDHINGNGLDNRKENLRIVTRAQNSNNRIQRFDCTLHLNHEHIIQLQKLANVEKTSIGNIIRNILINRI